MKLKHRIFGGLFLLLSCWVNTAVALQPYFSEIDLSAERLYAIRAHVSARAEQCRKYGEADCNIRSPELKIGFGSVIEEEGVVRGAKWLSGGIWHTMLFKEDGGGVVAMYHEAESHISPREELFWRFGPKGSHMLAAQMKSSTRQAHCGAGSDQWPQCGAGAPDMYACLSRAKMYAGL